MIDLSKLQPVGRKLWVKQKWDEYRTSKLAKTIDLSVKAYDTPTDIVFKEILDKAKWKSTVDKKVNYLLARKPLCSGQQEKLDDLLPFIRETAKQFILRGSLVWIVQGNGVDIDPKPLIMNNTIVVYSDENREDPAAYIRRYVDIELDEMTGAETEREYFECYYRSGDGWARDTWCYSLDGRDKTDMYPSLVFIELGKTGDAPLFAYVRKMLLAFDHILQHQDRTVVRNTKPLVEVRGYTGTSETDLEYAIEELSIAKVDGNGGVTIHTRQMDSNSIDLWAKRLLQEYFEATCTVGKDNELAYAQSGKAMDRLFVDMENSAKELAHVLEDALKAYFEAIGITSIDIVWNTDRPTDDSEIINGIVSSRGLISDKTLLEQHPWVDNVDEELKRIAEQNSQGMEDLYEMNEEEDML